MSVDGPAAAVSHDDSDAAVGALYQLIATAFDHPDPSLHAAMVDGTLAAEVEECCRRAALDVTVPPLRTDDDHELLCARFNDLFAVGVAARPSGATDGAVDDGNATAEGDAEVDAQVGAEGGAQADAEADAQAYGSAASNGGDPSEAGPPVPLYENCYRGSATWSEVNADLARAYEAFGVAVDEQRREHHDHLRLECEFAGYLARYGTGVDEAGHRARRDFLDRHLRPFAAGVRERLAAEPGTGVYEDLAVLLERVVAADHATLVDRFDDDSGGGGDP